MSSSVLPESIGVNRVLVIGTGAIAVCHLPSFVALLRQRYQAKVTVCLTRSARDLVSPTALAALTGRPVIPPEWSERTGPLHVEWARWAEAVVVWPATLNFLAACAHGLGDDVASSIVLSTSAPVFFAPSVASGAVESGPFRRAVRLLESDGKRVVGPVVGYSVADWQLSKGGCASPETVMHELASLTRQSVGGRVVPATPPTVKENNEHSDVSSFAAE
ncbi:flavoprotein [Microbispora hainanensis]|uniref:Flavoprotein n=1 Tax=Microbispora hainanensis TaxID=568844 RepID=A0ABZ1SK06_9ACTN|nr:flavoprotein [Microbispora hainanensis]